MQPTWFDRQGRILGRVGNPGTYFGLALSPDGLRAAVGIQAAQLDLWLLDLVRGDNRRFTYGKGINSWPVWSHDGNRIIFASSRAEGGYAFHIYQKEAGGASDE